MIVKIEVYFFLMARATDRLCRLDIHISCWRFTLYVNIYKPHPLLNAGVKCEKCLKNLLISFVHFISFKKDVCFCFLLFHLWRWQMIFLSVSAVSLQTHPVQTVSHHPLLSLAAGVQYSPLRFIDHRFGLRLSQAVDLLMKWTDLRPADLILQYRGNVIDKALLTPAPPKPPPLLSPPTHQLPLNPPPGDNRFSRATDQRASFGKATRIDLTPPSCSEVNSVLTYKKQVAHVVIMDQRNRYCLVITCLESCIRCWENTECCSLAIRIPQNMQQNCLCVSSNWSSGMNKV